MPAGFSLPTSAVESIVGIQFGIFSPDEIIKRSVVEVISQNTYDGNEPKIGGLFDPRMGVLDNGKKCRSCGQTNHNCPGHFGHYRLARPVYYIQFLPIVLNVLRCVCIRCSKLLIDKDSHPRIARKRGEARWREVYTLCSNISRCGQHTEDGCGARQPNRFVRDGIARIVAEWDAQDTETVKSEKVRQPLDVEYVLRLFRQITDEDVDFMGFSRHWCRPDWMICTVLPIPPPQVRPSVIQDNNQRSEDDLTHKLFEIIRMNKVLQEKIDKNSARNQIEEYTDVLQYHIATLVDNKIPGVAPSAQRGGRPLKSIQQRIGGKEGRVRYNIQGKRVEQSARTVITPDPNISIAEVGVPMKIAMNLTRPERVTQWNRKKLYKFVQNGTEVFPGAKSIVRSDGRMISLKHVNTKEIVLYNGDIVNRHLMDGDILLFNRQPTLHRLSMMGHIVKVLPFNTFRLNVSVTSPYNADFDGDEMNAHIPQSYEAFVELKEIAAVPHQIIRPRDATPVIGVVQDSLVGSYLATKPGNSFTRREFMNLMMWNKRFEGLPVQVDGSGKGSKYSGHQIISSLLSPINMEMTNSAYKDDKSAANIIKIREGLVLQGIFDKSIFNKPGRGIIHTTYNDYGPKDTVNLIDDIQCVIENYLIMKGFSVGISDLIADERTREEMNNVIKTCKKDIDEIILQLHNGLFVNNTGKTNQEEFETRCFINLNKALNEAGKVGEGSLSSENRLVAMVKAGSKGGPLNIAQMLACVGQQAPEGKRIPYGFTDRTLPHYKMYDDGAEARGFVESSFIRGLTPQEFFFHAMSGREGLIDTAVKTSETGYTQRQLIKAMEDLMINHDGTVRDSNGSIVQFYYGEDGINSTKVESCILPLDKMTDMQIKEEFGIDSVPEAFVDQILADRKMLIEGVFGLTSSIELFGPLNLERVILNIKIKFNLKEDTETTLTPDRVIADIQKILVNTQPFNKMWGAMLRYHFAPHKIINKEHFTEEAWSTIVDLVILKDWKAGAQPGEFVGIIAAQSIGEPATQMSAISSTIVVVNSKNLRYKGTIGSLIDTMLYNNKKDVVTIGDDSVVLDLKEDVFILGVSADEKTSWKRISQVSRHPANGGLVEVHTRTGRKTTATLSHSFLKRSPTGIVPVLGSDLKVGMRIPIAKKISEVTNPLRACKVGDTVFTLDKMFGWVCGIYLADGSFNGNTVKITKINPIVEEILQEFSDLYKFDLTTHYYQGEYGPGKDSNIKSKDLKNFLLDNFGTGSYTKSVGPIAYHAPLEFIQGLVGGYFDGDGNVNVDSQQIRVGSRSLELIKDINRLLGYCEMFGIMGEEKSASIPDKVFHTLNLPRKFAATYKKNVGFLLKEKADALEQLILYNERDDSHSQQEMIDKIPELGSIIAQTGKLLRMPGQSRTYGRWTKKESIGRKTLEDYISNFKEMMAVYVDPIVKEAVEANIVLLESALLGDVLWDEIVELVYLDDPKEYVYDFTVPGNDSFMVDDNILVHNTLNSVDWDTEIMIAKDGKVISPQIGEFIDNYLASCDQSKIKELPNKQLYVELDDGSDWQAISTDENGKMMWTKLEAITRHPVVNDDGTNTILEVELDSGRIVKATKAKSFLTLINGKIEGINGSELKVGDLIPIANNLDLSSIGFVKTLDLAELLPKTEWLYGDDFAKAKEACNGPDRHWFQKNQGKLFTVPYSRSDAFLDAINGRNTNAESIKPGFVYPKRTRPDISQIPSQIELTEEFGFFVGAYLAEGMSNDTQINITNNDSEYLEKAGRILAKWNVGMHLVKEERCSQKSGIKGTTTSLIVHSTLLAKVIQTVFGRVSYEKKIPTWLIQAPDEFLKGLVDAYICGDGTIEKNVGCVLATSVSKPLLVALSAILARFNIFSTMSSRMPPIKNFDSVKRNYTIRIPQKYSKVFAETFHLTIAAKQQILDYHFLLNTEVRKCRREEFNGVVLDKVKSIKEVEPIKGWVYDITVENTRNLTTLSLVNLKDTFHLAGVSSKSNMTRGVPRLKEMLKVTKNPKATALTVYLKPSFRENKDRVREVAQDLELTIMKNIVNRVAVYYDPSDEDSILEEDRELLKFYDMFESRETANESEEKPPKWSKWLLRLEFDREIMFNRNITIDDVNFVLADKFTNQIDIIYSDFNSQKLVMRIRLATGDNTYGDDLIGIKKLQNRILNNIVIRGLPGIRSATFRKDKDKKELIDGEYKAIEQYVLDTDGSNFIEVMNHPAVDGSKLYSTNVHDIYQQLGIEAARSVLFQEINVLFAEAGINYRHMGLLCDWMTRIGRFMTVDRYGINKNDTGPISKASFEETERVMLKAALYGELDPVTGISANIMTGQPLRGGTAFTQILLDEFALPGLMEGLPDMEEEEEEMEAPQQENIDNELYEDVNDACAATNLRMNLEMPATIQQNDEDDIEVTVIDT